jgi:hypothetical protein
MAGSLFKVNDGRPSARMVNDIIGPLAAEVKLDALDRRDAIERFRFLRSA